MSYLVYVIYTNIYIRSTEMKFMLFLNKYLYSGAP